MFLQSLIVGFAIAVGFVSGAYLVIETYAPRLRPQVRSELLGFVLAAAALSLSFVNYNLFAGQLVGLELPFVAAAALFGGWPAACIAMGPIIVAKLSTGAPIALDVAILCGAAAAGFATRTIAPQMSFRHANVLMLAALVALLPVLQTVGNVHLGGARTYAIDWQFCVLISVAAGFLAWLIGGRERRYEEARQALMLASALKGIPYCVSVKDRDGKFIAANPGSAKMIGVSCVADLMGKTDEDFLPSASVERFREKELEVMDRGEPIEFEEHIVAPSGDERWVATMKAPFVDDDGQIVGVISHNKDISEEKKRQLARDEYLAVASNGFRTHLSAVRASLQLAQTGATGPMSDKTHDLIGVAKENVERLIAMLGEAMDIEEVQAGRWQDAKENDDLVSTLEESILSARQHMDEKAVQIRLEDHATEARAAVNSGAMRRVIDNLLSNAIKASENGGTVTVRKTADSTHLRIDIVDHGVGMTDAVTRTIRDQLDHADAASASEDVHMGLGLFYTRIFVEQQNGEIGFETELGAGTVFHVKLPLAEVRGSVNAGVRNRRAATGTAGIAEAAA